MSGLAGLEQGSGRWRQALALYQRAQELDPENLSVADAIAAIDRTHGGRLRTDLEYRKTDGGEGTGLSIAVIEGLSGQQPLGDGWLLGFSANAAKVNAAQVQQPTGVVKSVIGWRQRSRILACSTTASTERWRPRRRYLTGVLPGVGVRGELPDDSGRDVPARRLPPAQLGFLPEPRRQRHQGSDRDRPAPADRQGSDGAPGFRGKPLQPAGRPQPGDHIDRHRGSAPGQYRQRSRLLGGVCP